MLKRTEKKNNIVRWSRVSAEYNSALGAACVKQRLEVLCDLRDKISEYKLTTSVLRRYGSKYTGKSVSKGFKSVLLPVKPF